MIFLKRKRELRCEQGSNLCGNIPLDFESNALTTRPSQLLRFQLNISCHILSSRSEQRKRVTQLKAAEKAADFARCGCY